MKLPHASFTQLFNDLVASGKSGAGGELFPWCFSGFCDVNIIDEGKLRPAV